MIHFIKSIFPFCIFIFFACSNTVSLANKEEAQIKKQKILKVGAENIEEYIPLLQNKKVAVVTNQTGVLRIFNEQDSVIGRVHLVDFLLQKKINVQAVFAPEHGFRGKADAGAKVKDAKDNKTGLTVFSLHGKYKKPQKNQLKGIDIVVFDIQDVGVRFYTYLSTLHLVMVACAENGIPLIVLDRPNPNGHYIDGAVMGKKYFSFLGMNPVPIVYGMTIGEYAMMLNGEKWLPNNFKCDLKVIKLQNWTHKSTYELPIKPSPNLSNATAVNLYPSLCLFEQTSVSVGRGTPMPFQIFGSPFLSEKLKFSFVPKAMEGAKYPKHKNKICYGVDLQKYPQRLNKIELKWLIYAYETTANKDKFFKKNFEYLAGTRTLREQIKNGLTAEEIRKSWVKDLQKFKKIRKKYLLYPDFEE